LRRLRGRFVLILCALVLTVNLTMMGANEVLQAPSDRGESMDVVVPAGTTAEVARALSAAGVIDDPLVFRAAVFFTRKQGPIRAGEYLFPARASLQDIMRILRYGAPVEHQVTIPEGLTGAQIAKILNAAPDARGHVTAPPEGAVLPQTYAYTMGTSRSAILLRAEQAMDAAVAAAWAGRDKTIILTSPDQAVTLASIVQEETPLAAELPKIAAVYENRLAMGMKLQADPTVIFAATGGAAADGLPIFRPDLANASPYNTYVVDGLPPGPICSPGLAAIQAVLHPAASDALFFVATGTGGHVFSKDYRQHLANVAAYRAVAGQ
jgi:UPF0755 protein